MLTILAILAILVALAGFGLLIYEQRNQQSHLPAWMMMIAAVAVLIYCLAEIK